jgi:hypothetical protein
MPTTPLSPPIVKPSTGTVLARFLLAGMIGIALTVAGELSAPWDLDNAKAVGQTGLVLLVVCVAVVWIGLRWRAAVRWLLLALAVLTPLTAVAYFLPLGWMLGCAGVALAWSLGALARGHRPPDTRVPRACGLICGFVAAAWFAVYLSALITNL